MSILFEAVFFKKRFSAVNLMGTLFAVIGVAFVMLNKEQFNNSNWIGNLLIVLSVITACLGGIMIQKLSKTNDHLTTSTLIHLVGSIIFLGDLLFSSLDPSRILQSISVIQWLFILFFSIVNGAVATVLWTRGISEIGLAKTSAYLPLVPFVGIISNSLLLGEQLTIYHGIGLACVAIGTFFATREEGFTFAKALSILR
jgi:drug/metabolite transporter (DMT)-like permease